MLERFRTKIARLIEPAETKAVTLTGFDFVSRGMGNVSYFGGAVPGDVEALLRETSYAAAVLSYAAIKYRATNVSEPPLRVYDRTEEGWEVVEDHALARLLEQPSPDYDMGQTLWLTQSSLDVDGRALWTKDADRMQRLGRLMPFMGREYTEEAGTDRIFGLYRLRTTRGELRLLPEQVVAWRFLNPADRYNPVSPTDVALSWLNLGASVKLAVRNAMLNGMFPGTIISPHHEWHPDPEEFERFKAEIERHHQGPKNAGKPLIALGGVKTERVAFSLKDMLPDEIMDRIEATVAMAYGIAPVILGALVGLRNSPWSQMSEARRFTYEDTIAPLWRMHEKALTSQLLLPVDATPGRMIRFDTSGIEALQRDQSRDITDADKAKHWTIDERRMLTGQKPIGGDRGAWIELLDKPEPAVPQPGGADPDEEVQDEERGYRPGSRDVVWSRFDLMQKTVSDDFEEMAAAQLARDRLSISLAVNESEFVAAWTTALERGADVVARGVKPGEHPSAAGLADALIDATDTEAEWSARAERAVRRAARTAAKDIARSQGIAFDLAVSGADRYAHEHAARLVTNVGRTTRAKIRGAVADGLADGDSIPDLAKRIRESTAFSRERATLIARTETTEVVNGAQHRTMADYDAATPMQTVEKSWLSARDRDVRKEHQLLDDGSWIRIEQTFQNGRTHPGDPNCRCTLIYRISET